MNDVIMGISVNWFLFLIQLLTFAAMLRYVYFTYNQSRAQTYFKIADDLTSDENQKEIKKIRSIIKDGKVDTQDNQEWNENDYELLHSITTRYQIVAHIVQRNFIEKQLYFENFSITTIEIWNASACFIMKSRQKYDGSFYQRRDFERLALQSRLYQLRLGFSENIKLIDDGNKKIIDCSVKEIELIKRRIKSLKRRNLLIEKIKSYFI